MKELTAADLRCGNYYFYQSFGNIIKLDSQILLSVLSDDRLVDIHKIQPIPLTEEWLERFGFKRITKYELSLKVIEYEDEFFKHTKELELYANFDDNEFNLSLDNVRTESDGELECVSISLKHIQHVHTLQNLFFSLCGEELTLKTQ